MFSWHSPSLMNTGHMSRKHISRFFGGGGDVKLKESCCSLCTCTCVYWQDGPSLENKIGIFFFFLIHMRNVPFTKLRQNEGNPLFFSWFKGPILWLILKMFLTVSCQWTSQKYDTSILLLGAYTFCSTLQKVYAVLEISHLWCQKNALKPLPG